MSDVTVLRCPQCDAKQKLGPSCTCGVAYIHVRAGEVAERRLRADPTHGDPMIAHEEGIDQATVWRKRQELESTNAIALVEKTIGLDGKWRKAKRDTKTREEKRKSQTKIDDSTKRNIAEQFIDNGKSANKIAQEFNVSHGTVDAAVAREEGRREALVDPPIDPSTLPKTSQQKLEAAIRQHQKKLDAIFEERVQSEIQRRIKEMVYPRLQEKEKDAARIIKAHRGVLKVAEYNTILRCLHPDMMPDNQQKAKAFQIWHENKIVLVSQKEEPKQYQSLPTIEELMAMRRANSTS